MLAVVAAAFPDTTVRAFTTPAKIVSTAEVR
jgi:hypothetical protein